MEKKKVLSCGLVVLDTRLDENDEKVVKFGVRSVANFKQEDLRMPVL